MTFSKSIQKRMRYTFLSAFVKIFFQSTSVASLILKPGMEGNLLPRLAADRNMPRTLQVFYSASTKLVRGRMSGIIFSAVPLGSFI